MNFYFIGVTTGQSAMARILPLWAKNLDINLNLIGIDLPLDADPSRYRKAVLDLKEDTKAIGSVVTTHKLKTFEHASDLFTEFDALAELTREVCMIRKHGSHLAGLSTPDCLSITLSLKSMLGKNYWREHVSDVLCFGAGGIARAIALSLLCDFESLSPLTTKHPFKPRKLHLVDIEQRQLQSIRSLLEPLRDNMDIQYVCQSKAEDNVQILAHLPKGSLIVNATGMGKDRPGSPLSDQASFPANSIIWDLNYRGERQFLKQARSQELEKSLQIHDGWLCFMHGWTQALQLALQQTFPPDQFRQLFEIAEPFRI
jgi:shikimate dehydrogenase